MPKRETAPNGAPTWIELMSSDTDKSRAFYGELFGWTSESAGEEYGGYINFSKDGLPIAGCMKKGEDQQALPDLWSIYLAADDIKEVANAVAPNGGEMHLEPMDVMALGKMAFFMDASGAAVGAWEPGEHKGFQELGEANTPVWFELHTRDHAAAVRFYEKVFGWDTRAVSDTDEFRYTVVTDPTGNPDEDWLAGVMDASAFLPDGIPAHWSVYIGTDDVDASLAKAVELGGSIVLPAEDTPYGRLAQLADSTGALIKLRGDNKG
jgi:uncharacterized protein